MKLKVDCVWSLTRREFMRFLKTAEKYDSIIDYYAIVGKLTKADRDGIEPPDTLVGLNLVKNIKDCKEANKTNLLYVIKNLNEETVDTIREVFGVIYESHIVELNLIIINRDDYPKKGVLSRFDAVKFIEKV